MTARSTLRSRLLLGAAAGAVVLASPAWAGSDNPFARVVNPAAQAARAAAQQVQQGANVTAASQRALAAFAQAAAIRRSMDAAQAAARAAAAAAAANVPDGMKPGGLQIDPRAGGDPSLWLGADAPTETSGADGRTKVDIDQTQQQAILNWQTFNVGKNTDVSFDQGGANWTVLNRVNDPDANPTQILGTIKAPGTVLIMNRNGVIFGGASQVNVGNLLAAAGSMTDDQFLGQGIYSTQSGNNYVPGITDALGAVTVQAGAQIATNTPASVTDGGGYVMLLGGSVENDGSITTPMGQTLLAAGDSFLLRPGLGTEENQKSTTRGSEVSPVIAAGSTNGAVTNKGDIYSQQGDVTLAGRTITQAGVAVSTSSVNQRGTIHLLNAASDAQGSVTLTGNSLTTILPELDSDDTALDSQRDADIAAGGQNGLAAGQFDNLSLIADRPDQSRVEIVSGGDIEFQGGSYTIAQGGQIAASAADRIQTDTGAWLDVSGVRDVTLDPSTNAVLVNVQGNELRDSPVNRDNPDKAIYSAADDGVWVNVNDLIYVPAGTGGYDGDRYYTPGGLLEVSGYLGNVEHSIGEWDAVGGTITLQANEVVAQSGSMFNIAGGSLDYAAGTVMQTLLQGADGKMYTADNAPAGIEMVSVGKSFTVAHTRWGDQYKQTFQNPFVQKNIAVQQDAYIVGRDAGQLVLSAPTVLFDGDIDAEVVKGQNQTGARPDGAIDGYKLGQSQAPLEGGISVGKFVNDQTTTEFDTDVSFGAPADDADTALTLDDPVSGDRRNTAWFDAGALSGDDLGSLNVTTSGDISVDAPLTLANGAQISFIGTHVSLNADVTAHGGSLTMGDLNHGILAVNEADHWWSVVPTGSVASMTIAPDVTVDLTGLWTNAYSGGDSRADAAAADLSGLAYLDGGTFTADTTGAVTLAKGAVIDVSSGGAILPDGSTAGGKGGNVTLIADDYSELPSTTFLGNADLTQPLTLDGTVRAYGFKGGGTLTLGAGQPVIIGDDAGLAGGTLDPGTPTDVSTRLTQDVTIAAGGTMPIDYMIVNSTTPLDTPLAEATQIPSIPAGSLMTAAPWTVPAGMYAYVQLNGPSQPSTYYAAGSVVPANSVISSLPTLPAGTIISSAAFPHGIPVIPSIVASYKAGDVVPEAVTIPTGTIIPAGTSFDQPVAVQTTLGIDPTLFQSGFSNYDIGSTAGMTIAAGTQLDPTVPIYQFNASSIDAPTGTATADAAGLWTPPVYLADPANGTVTKRVGADLTLTSLHDFTMQEGSSIAVDPGQAATIYANAQTTIDGDISAPGGSILITSLQDRQGDDRYNYGYGELSLSRSIWIGDDAVLDVAAQAWTAEDQFGHTFGVVPDGGSITLGAMPGQDGTPVVSNAFVVIRPGAVLDASGASATLDLSDLSGAFSPVTVASDGGTIGLYSGNGLYIDGTVRAAAGGAGASGGELDLANISQIVGPTAPSPGSPYSIGPIPDEMQALHNITVVQNQEGSGLSADAEAGKIDPTLQFGQARIGVDQIQAGGFGSLGLYSRDLIQFSGNVDLSMARSLRLSGAVLSTAVDTPDINVSLSAPYVRIDGFDADGTIVASYYPGLNTLRGPSLNTAADSSIVVSADLIDLYRDVRFGVHGHQGNGYISYTDTSHYVLAPQSSDIETTTAPDIVDAPGFHDVTFDSSGDIRLGDGDINASNNLTLQAAQIYPLSNAVSEIMVGQMLPPSPYGGIGNITFDPDATLTVLGNGEAPPQIPASVFGSLSFVAPTIDQEGVIRAPLGRIFFGTNGGQVAQTPTGSVLTFGGGSLTSTSAAGLDIPYGGTSDGVTYVGADTPAELGATTINANGYLVIPTGIAVSMGSVHGEQGAVLDLSGGGNLTGAGFVSGRGGSVDVLKVPLVDANPVNRGAANDQVYAIVSGYASDYAPAIATNGAGDPAIGQQITIPDGVPGLPAGTYTLLPSSYALEKGGYRVEIGGATDAPFGSTVSNAGITVTTGYLGVANTGIRDSLARQVIVTSGGSVRDYSQYNETNYVDFEKSQAALFDGVRPRLPEDGGVLQISVAAPLDGSSPLTFDGTAKLKGVDDGISGAVIVASANGAAIDITAPGATPIAGDVSISSDDLNAFKADTLMIGGGVTYYADGGDFTGAKLYFSGGSNVINILDGADIRAGQVFLDANSINVAGGATIDTRGLGSTGIDSTLGYLYGNTSDSISTPGGPAVLAVANGYFNFLPAVGTGTIDVESGASLLTEGTIALAAPGKLTMGDVNFGAKYLAVTQETVNIGSQDAIAAAAAAGILPDGWNLTQDVLDRLLDPSADSGVPALQQLTVTAGSSINFFGSVSLDASGKTDSDVQFEISTPAIYGLGGKDDSATITADDFLWNGVRTGNGSNGFNGVPYGNQDPGAVIPGGAGTGLGTLNINAKQIAFGYDDQTRPTDGVTLGRLALGFSTVNLTAADLMFANDDGTLVVGQSRDADGNLTGGDLNVATPLIASQNGATMAYAAAGDIDITAPDGAAPGDVASIDNLGGTVSFTGDNMLLDTAVALPSGQLKLAATHDLTLGDDAVVDLSGRAIPIFDQEVYSWGGDLVLTSAQGDIVQSAASTIDVSASNNDAGTITAVATDADQGKVDLVGSLKGSGGDGYNQGQISIAAQDMGDFAALNDMLNDAGFFTARSFDLKSGDLTIGDEVQAHYVSISVDGGSLTVDGRIDASGAAPGTIRLGARDDLTIGSDAMLDAHGTVLQTDSYGAPVEASNTADVELTTTQGTVTLGSGATIDMTTPDGVARGQLAINAPRIGSTGASATGGDAPANATGGDVAVSAAGPLDIRGAETIAVNAFASYDNAPADPNDANDQVVDQAYLDEIDQDNQAFITAAYDGDVAGGELANGLGAKLSGLTAYADVFHLRPGVEIRSAKPNGDLTIQGDIDLSGYRYGPKADSAVRGSGEPGLLLIRAGGNLNIKGSVNDGFAPPPGTPDDNGWIVMKAGLQSSDTALSGTATIGSGSTFPADSVLGYAIPILGTDVLNAGTPAPKSFTLSQSVTLPAGWTLTAAMVLPVTYQPGSTVSATLSTLPAAIVTQADWYIEPGSAIANYFDSLGGADVYGPDGSLIQPYPGSGSTIPAGSTLPANDSYMGIPAGFVVPADVFPNGIIAGNQNVAAGTALTAAAVLPAGTQIPAGFTLPEQVVTQVGASVAANVVLPTKITVGNTVTVSAAFTAAAPIVTPTETFSAGDTVPAGTVLPYGTTVAAGNSLPFAVPVTSMIWPAGAPLAFTGAIETSADTVLAAGDIIPAGSDILGAGGSTTSITRTGQNWVTAQMLAPGSQSWSMTFASGADLSAADAHVLLTGAELAGGGDMVLNDPHFSALDLTAPVPSVVRTGTGSLSLLAGGDFDEETPFGVYTAGTAIAETGTDANDPYNVARGEQLDGTVLGSANAAYEASLNPERMYYTQGGGDLLLVAQGDIGGKTIGDQYRVTSDSIGDWLWRQGGAELDQSAAWGINFGSYAVDVSYLGAAPRISGFEGIGALGGGDVTLRAGGDIGDDGKGVLVAVGGSGRVLSDGTLAQTGGGTLSVTAGGNIGTGGNLFVDLRGDTDVEASDFGYATGSYFGYSGSDPRRLDSLRPYGYNIVDGGSFAPGDGDVTVRARGDLIMGAIIDPGRVGIEQQTETNGVQAVSWFSLWGQDTSVDVLAGGGTLTPFSTGPSIVGLDSTMFLPPIINGAAPGGDIYLFADGYGSNMQLPSPDGALNLLAGGLITMSRDGQGPVGPLSTSLATLATPFDPGWETRQALGTSFNILDTNNWSGTSSLDGQGFQAYSYSYDPTYGYTGQGGNPFVFGPNTVSDDSTVAAPGLMSHIYALDSDILNLTYGQIYTASQYANGTYIYTNYYRAAKPVDILAGGDIVGLKGEILHNNETDVSTIAASGDIIYAGTTSQTYGTTGYAAGLQIAGPGTLEVTAGGNIYEGSTAAIDSTGPLISGDDREGASIALQAGVGAGEPGVGQAGWDDFAALYLDPANLAAPGPLADQPGKVAKDYNDELFVWLKQRYGYAGGQADALAYFRALPGAQQRVFLRQVYYAELTAGGREYNDPDSSRFGSYLRGRNAIAALFPKADDNHGDITIFSATSGTLGSANYQIKSGFVHTDFGGDIQLLAPSGAVTVGSEGLTPGADAGLITQGAGDIDIYADESVLLGLSRIMTTFGGDILAWSATGDINAGRGAKTTILFTPPRRTYDIYGNVALAPQVPSTGAGIATLAPIPDVPPGDVDLIAPLGTVDAGEAGIRVSGNINVAALHVVNAANIEVKGNATGLPTAVSVNIGALTSASNAASAVSNEAERLAERARPQLQRDLPAIVQVTFVGFGDGQ